MKNKGRKHKSISYNQKGYLTMITRPINQMSSGAITEGMKGKSKKWVKRKWQKRMRGYLKSQTKQDINHTILA